MGEVTAMDEKEWQAESDARTLVEADVIRNDPERLKAAQEKAKKLVEEKKRESEAMARVAEGQFDYPSMKKEV